MHAVEFLAILPFLTACGESADPEGKAESDAGEESDGNLPEDIAVCSPESGDFSLTIDNPYSPFVVGSLHEFEGLEAGTDPASYSLEVLDETEEVEGVETRVVKKMSYADGELEAVALDYFAQAEDGTVCYFGTTEDVYEDGSVAETDGWRHGEDGARAVVFMPAEPEVGLRFTAAYLPPDEVEVSEVTELGVEVETPAGTFDDTLTILEEGPSLKKFAQGIGEIYDDGIELISYE